MARRNAPALSAHAVETVARLMGSIEAPTLSAEFAWSIEKRTGNTIVLNGVPRDEATSLFCPRIRVVLIQSGLPQTWEVATHGEWVTVKTPEPMTDAAIVLTSFETPSEDSLLPPPPAPLRLAVESNERPLLK